MEKKDAEQRKLLYNTITKVIKEELDNRSFEMRISSNSRIVYENSILAVVDDSVKEAIAVTVSTPIKKLEYVYDNMKRSKVIYTDKVTVDVPLWDSIKFYKDLQVPIMVEGKKVGVIGVIKEITETECRMVYVDFEDKLSTLCIFSEKPKKDYKLLLSDIHVLTTSVVSLMHKVKSTLFE